MEEIVSISEIKSVYKKKITSQKATFQQPQKGSQDGPNCLRYYQSQYMGQMVGLNQLLVTHQW
jgi:hypothetical protein